MGAIIWLASYPKSGNTWLRVFLHNLLVNPDKPADINTLGRFCLGEDMAQYFNQFDPRPLSTWTPEEIADKRPQVHELLTQAFPDSVFVKTHNFLGEIDGGPLVNLEVTAGAINFMERAQAADKPFFLWWNSTRPSTIPRTPPSRSVLVRAASSNRRQTATSKIPVR